MLFVILRIDPRSLKPTQRFCNVEKTRKMLLNGNKKKLFQWRPDFERTKDQKEDKTQKPLLLSGRPNTSWLKTKKNVNYGPWW